MYQRHVGFSKGLRGGVAQQVCVPLGIKAVRRVDWAIHSVLFIVFGVVLQDYKVSVVLLSHVWGIINVYYKATDQNQMSSFYRCLVKYCMSQWNLISLFPGLMPMCQQLLLCLLCVYSSTRTYHAEKLPKTNLVFVIADAKLTCLFCDTKPLIQDEQQCILLPNAAIIWHRTWTFNTMNRCLKMVCFWQDNCGWTRDCDM